MSATLTNNPVVSLGDGFYEMQVQSDRDMSTFYSVVYDDSTGKCSCTCPSYKFGSRNPCKHIWRNADTILSAVEDYNVGVSGEVNTTATYRGVVTRVGGNTSTLNLDENTVDLFDSVLKGLDSGDALVIVRE